MILNQLSKRERTLFLITVSVVVLAVLLNFIFIPLTNRWRRLNSDILALNTRISRYVRVLRAKKMIESRYRLYADYLKIKGSKEEAQAVVLQEIEGIARKSNVVLTNIIPASIEETGFYYQFNVRIELESAILPLSRFLYEIRKSKQLLKVDKLSITTKAGTPGLLKCSLQLIKILIP